MQGASLQQQAAALQAQGASLQQQANSLQAQGDSLKAQQQQAQNEQKHALALQQQLTDELTYAGGDARGTDPRLVKLQNALARVPRDTCGHHGLAVGSRQPSRETLLLIYAVVGT